MGSKDRPASGGFIRDITPYERESSFVTRDAPRAYPYDTWVYFNLLSLEIRLQADTLYTIALATLAVRFLHSRPPAPAS